MGFESAAKVEVVGLRLRKTMSGDGSIAGRKCRSRIEADTSEGDQPVILRRAVPARLQLVLAGAGCRDGADSPPAARAVVGAVGGRGLPTKLIPARVRRFHWFWHLQNHSTAPDSGRRVVLWLGSTHRASRVVLPKIVILSDYNTIG